MSDLNQPGVIATPDAKALVNHVFQIDLTEPVTKTDCSLILKQFGVEEWFRTQPEFSDAENIAASLEAIEDRIENIELISEALAAREAALEGLHDATKGLRGRTTSIILAFKSAVDAIFKDIKDKLGAQISDLDERKKKILCECNDAYVEGLNAGGMPSPPPAVLGGKKIEYVPTFDPENSDMEVMLSNLPSNLFRIDKKEMQQYIVARGFGVGSEEARKLGIEIVSGVKERRIPARRK